MNVPNFINTCQGDYSLIIENPGEAIKPVKSLSEELYFAIECIQNIERGLNSLPNDVLEAKPLNQGMPTTLPLKKSDAQSISQDNAGGQGSYVDPIEGSKSFTDSSEFFEKLFINFFNGQLD